MKIVYRIGAAVLALCVFPAALFLPILQYAVSAVITNIGDSVTLHYLYTRFTDESSPLHGLFDGSGGDFFEKEAVKRLVPAGVSFLVFFALALLLAVAVFVVAAVSYKRLAVIILSAAGILSIIGSYVAFGKFAAPLLSGELSVLDFFDIKDAGTLLGIVISFAGSAIKVEQFTLASAPLIMGVVFAVIIVWSGAFLLTEDPAEKRAAGKPKTGKKHRRNTTAR